MGSLSEPMLRFVVLVEAQGLVWHCTKTSLTCLGPDFALHAPYRWVCLCVIALSIFPISLNPRFEDGSRG